jgi:uncharacterized protein YaaQ
MRKMVMAVVSRDQGNRVLDSLVSAGYGATFTESRGGVLQQAQLMLFIAVDADKVENVLTIIKDQCRTKVEVSEHSDTFNGQPIQFTETRTAEVGYAVVFVWDLDHFDTY